MRCLLCLCASIFVDTSKLCLTLLNGWAQWLLFIKTVLSVVPGTSGERHGFLKSYLICHWYQKMFYSAKHISHNSSTNLLLSQAKLLKSTSGCWGLGVGWGGCMFNAGTHPNTFIHDVDELFFPFLFFFFLPDAKWGFEPPACPTKTIKQLGRKDCSVVGISVLAYPPFSQTLLEPLGVGTVPSSFISIYLLVSVKARAVDDSLCVCERVFEMVKHHPSIGLLVSWDTFMKCNFCDCAFIKQICQI